MANIDKVSVKNTVYNIVSPAVVSDYIEVIGGACTKPDGYVEDEVILAKQNDVQLLFKATQTIAFGANIVENTNCVRTTLEEVLKNAGGGGASSADQVSYDNTTSGLLADNVQEALDEVQGNVVSVNQTLTNKLANMQGVNLLDNPWFTINQRGQASYSGESISKQYTFDRWQILWAPSDVTVTKNSDGTVTYTNNGSADNQQMLQFIETPKYLSNKQVTISVDVVAITGEVLFGLALSNDPWTSFVEKRFSSTGIQSASGIIGDMSGVGAGGLKVYFSLDAGESITIRAVKLELGTVSTLAHDTAPNYQQELAKCMRYYQRLGRGEWVKGDADRTCLWMVKKFDVPMRAIPTVTIINQSISFYGMIIDSNVDTTAISKGIEEISADAIGFIQLLITSSHTITSRTIYSANIDFLEASADL